MQQNRTFRVVKRGQKQRTGETPAVANAAPQAPARNAERELKAVVSGWVREHRESAEELRRAAALLLSNARPRASANA